MVERNSFEEEIQKYMDKGDYNSLNSMLGILERLPDGRQQYQLDKDPLAVEAYMNHYVIPNSKDVYENHDSFYDLVKYLVDNKYYSEDLINNYSESFINDLHSEISEFDFEFKSFIGAYKFYRQYALMSRDSSIDNPRFLEDFVSKAVIVALHLADGDEKFARELAKQIMTGRFQPATPTYLNAGRNDSGMLVSCYLLLTSDNMESIAQTITRSLQLSKRGGGVGICLTNLRETASSIKGYAGLASGPVPVMKILEDSFSYADQLGQRQGAGAVYISAHHPDIMKVLDTKRENADEKIRIKTLSIGVVITDALMEAARKGEDYYLFSPLDVEKEYGVPMTSISITEEYQNLINNRNIKKIPLSARKFLMTVAELQFESGYPYIMFEDQANRRNNIDGRINMSNLCSEILQVNTETIYDKNKEGVFTEQGRDISCNLGSLNIAKVMEKSDSEKGVDFENTVSSAVRALTSVSDNTDLGIVASVDNGNHKSHAIGLGAMNLHGFLGEVGIEYGSEESLDFVNCFFATTRYFALKESMKIAKERKETFFEFDKSNYAKKNEKGHSIALERYTSGIWLTTPQTDQIRSMLKERGFWTPSTQDWIELDNEILENGLYNAYLMAVAPTGSISYVNNSTASVHPIVSQIETRKEGKIGRVYVASPHMTNENRMYFKDAYSLGYKPIIDVYSVAQKHVDQGMSLTLFYNSDATTRDMNKAYIYAWSRDRVKNENGKLAIDDPDTAWKSGFIKTLYYARINQKALDGTQAEDCVSCSI